MLSADPANEPAQVTLPDHLGIRVTRVEGSTVRAELAVRPHTMAMNGFLHAGAVVTLADTACAHGCLANLPAGAQGFTTIELKSNHLGTARGGTLDCVATGAHMGRTTQVWDAVVTHRETGKAVALFRCTQMILHGRSEVTAPRSDAASPSPDAGSR